MIWETFSIASSIVVIIGMAYLIKRNIELEHRCHCSMFHEFETERDEQKYHNHMRKQKLMNNYKGIESYYSNLVHSGKVSEAS